MAWGAGNRDPRVFQDPDTFDMHRPRKPILTFGGGPRICKGRHLAMVEAQVALRALVERGVTIELLNTEPVWSPAGMLRTVEALAVAVG